MKGILDFSITKNDGQPYRPKWWAVLLTAVLIASIAGGPVLLAQLNLPITQSGKQRFDWLVVRKITFDGSAGGLDLSGSLLTWDDDDDTYSQASTDDQLETTIGAATGFFRILTGNFRVGNGTPNVTQDGEDAYIEGVLDVDGASYLQGNVSDYDGTFTIADDALVDGQADAVQLTVQGYTTQTAKTFVVETSGGTDMFTVDNSGNIVVEGTSDLQGNVSDSDSALTVADNALVDGQADVVQLTVQGNGTQTSDVFVVENSSTTDLLTVDNSGNTYIAGNVTVVGSLEVTDEVIVDVTTLFSETVDLNGNTLTLDADGDTSMVASDDDVISVTLGAATGDVYVLTGNLRVGDGTPGDAAMNGEDLYVEGQLEVDGTAFFDAAVDMDSTLDMSNNVISNIGAAGTDFSATGGLTLADGLIVTTGGVDVQGGNITMQNDETLSNSYDGAITATVAANGWFAVATGNLRVGDGTPSVALDGEDAYVEGALEVDGAMRLDGGIDINGALDVSSAATLASLVVTGTSDLQGNVADSTGDLTIADNVAVTGTLDVAGAATLASLVVTGTSDLQGNISDSGGVLTIADNALVDGAADAVQLTVQGYTTQTNDLFVVEDSTGTDRFQVGASSFTFTGGQINVPDGTAAAPIWRFTDDLNTGLYRVMTDTLGFTAAGALACSVSDTGVTVVGTLDVAGVATVNSLVVTTTSDLQGDVSDSGGAFTIADNVVITNGLDMNNTTITNIGAAGTDFGSDGSLITAQTITVTAGGLVVSAGTADFAGDIVMQNDETLSNAFDGSITATVAADHWFNVATGNLVVGNPALASLTLNGNDTYVEGTLEADGAARFDGGATVAGDLEISNGLFLPMFDDLTINDGDTITVTTISIYGLDSGGAVTMTLAACAHDGQSVTLIGDDANTITINATNLRTSDGNALTLGQYDVIVLVCMDAEWLHVSKSANQ